MTSSTSTSLPTSLLALLMALPAASRAQLPRIALLTLGQSIPDEPKIDVDLRLTVGSSIDYAGPAGIEIRGRSSQSFPKQGFALETRLPDGGNAEVQLLGMPAENDWVLHGPYADKSLVRNALIYATARALGRYAPRTRFVELEVDGDYRGLYLLTEEVKLDPARVRGDYLLQINFGLDEQREGWLGRAVEHEGYALQTTYKYDDPDADRLLADEQRFIRERVDQLERILELDDFADPSFGYPAYLDVESWVDYVLLNELSGDVDAYFGSTFLTLEQGRLAAGPVWDHNFAFGNADYCAGTDPTGFAIEHQERCEGRIVPLIFARVWDDPQFRERVARRYFELRSGPFGPGLWGRLDSLALAARPAVADNFARWPVLGEYIWPNPFVGRTWDSELGYLRTWIEGRLAWLDVAFAEIGRLDRGRVTGQEGLVLAPQPARIGGVVTITPEAPEAFGGHADVEVFPLIGGPPVITGAGQLPLRLDLPTGLPPGPYALRVSGAFRQSTVLLLE